MQRREQRCGELGLLACKPLEVRVQGAVRGNVLVSRHLLRGIAVDEPPPLLIECPDLPRNARELARDALIVYSPAGLDAAPQLSGIEHSLPDQLEHLAFEDMGADLRIPAALDPRPIVGRLRDELLTRRSSPASARRAALFDTTSVPKVRRAYRVDG
jgi:hypothetical protein